jgi:hypothetical protein
MRFFFYGTLLDHDVTALVLGRRLPPSAFRPAILPGFRRCVAKGVSYPVLLRDRRSEVAGAVVAGLSRRDVARLSAYEGPRYRVAFWKVLVGRSLTTVAVFEPLERSFQPIKGSWSLPAWQRRDKRAFVDRIRPAFSAHPAYSKQ